METSQFMYLYFQEKEHTHNNLKGFRNFTCLLHFQDQVHSYMWTHGSVVYYHHYMTTKF